MGKKKDKDGDEEMVDDTTNTDTIERLFGIELESTIKNSECEDEPEEVKKESVLKLSCHIDNNNNPINSLSDGLDISLEGEMEKFSQQLQRNAVFKKSSKVNKLPSYLTV